MEDNRKVECPLVDEFIEDIDCIENRDIVDGMIIESAMPERFKKKKSWREICEKCSWHDY